MGFIDKITGRIATRYGYEKISNLSNPSNPNPPNASPDNVEKILSTGNIPYNFTAIINPSSQSDFYLSRPYTPDNAIDDYKDVVYDVINFIARPFSTIGYKLYDKRGKELDNSLSQKVYELFNRPFKNIPEAKQKITQVDLLYIIALDLLIFGNCFLKIKDEKNPSYLLPLSPQRMGYKLNKNGFIDYYIYNQSTQYETIYQPSEIIHLQYIDPKVGLRFVWGLSPLAAHKDLLSTLQKMKNTQDDAFGKSGLPSILAKVDGARTGDNTKEGLARIREDITNRIYKQKDKVSVIDAELMDIQFIEHKLAELEFNKSYEQIGHSIAAMYGVDPMFIGFNQTTNLAQARAAIFVFGKYTLKPFLDMIQSQLNLDLIEPAWGDNVVFKFNWLMEEDRESLRADLRLGLDKALITPNEGRGMLWGMKPITKIPEMDKPLIQMATVSIGDQFKGRTGTGGTDGGNTPGDNSDRGGRPETNVEIIDDETKEIEIAMDGMREGEIVTKDDVLIMIDDMIGSNVIGTENQFGENSYKEINNADEIEIEKAYKKEKNKWQQLTNLALRAKQPACTRKMQEYFERQFRDVEKRLETFQSKMAIVKRNPSEKDLSSILFGMSLENEIMINLLMPELVDILNYSIESHIGVLESKLEFQSVSDKVIKILENGNRAEGIFGFVKEVNETTVEQLRKTLIEGIKKGESVGQLAQRITAVKADAVGYRAEGIARAVVIGGYNQAGLLTAREDIRVNGGEALKNWYTSNPAMRETHNMNEAEAKKKGGIPLEQPYEANGQMYPGDPNVAPGQYENCKCSQGIVIKRPNR